LRIVSPFARYSDLKSGGSFAAMLKIGPLAVISSLAVASVGGAATLFALNGGPENRTEAAAIESRETPPPTAGDGDPGRIVIAEAASDSDERTPAAAPASLDFSIGSIDDLRRAQLSPVIDKIESVEGVAEETKVWVAEADVASAPGAETFYHVKGPLTCGRIGCELIVISASGSVLLETIGEDVSAPAIDTLVVNQGSGTAVVWVFDGAEFVEKR